MHIVSALFYEEFSTRQAPGPSARLDVRGVLFSQAAPAPVPVTVSPHLLTVIYCPADVAGQGVFEVVFRPDTLDPERADAGDHLARNVSLFTVDPGKFTYRLVKADLEFTDYTQVFAHCRVGKGDWHHVPFTLLPPAS